MERKEEARWAPVLATYLAANETLVERAAENGLMGFDLGDNAILRCHASLENPYIHTFMYERLPLYGPPYAELRIGSRGSCS
jgi:hypothetical protein